MSTDTATPTATPTPTPDPNAHDLREIEVQVSGSNSSESILGEIDRGDPSTENGYYEPVVFAAQANDTITVSVSSNSGDPQIALRAPNRARLASGDDSLSDGAAIENETLPVTGRYTVRVSAADDSPSETFAYRLTVSRKPDQSELEPRSVETEWSSGNISDWNQTVMYSDFAYDFAVAANSPNGPTDAEPSLWVNTERDYVVITMIDGPHFNGSQRQDIVASLALTNVLLYEAYTNDSYKGINESWVPDRTYVRFVTPEDRELYRINGFSKRAAKEGANMDGVGVNPSIDDFFASIYYGPANDMYDPQSNSSVENRGQIDYIEPDSEVKMPPIIHEDVDKTMSINGSINHSRDT